MIGGASQAGTRAPAERPGTWNLLSPGPAGHAKTRAPAVFTGPA